MGLPLAFNYVGSYLVLEKGPKVFKLQVGTREEYITRDQLKPHMAPALLAVAKPLSMGAHPREESRCSSEH